MTTSGTLMFPDWQPIRRAIDAAYGDLGMTVPNSIPAQEWNLVGLAILSDRENAKPKCFTCGKKLPPGADIRCLDCKMVFCEHCAATHFWPNGRTA